MGHVKIAGMFLRTMAYKTLEDVDIESHELHIFADELADANNSSVLHDGCMPRQCVFGALPRVAGQPLPPEDLQLMHPIDRFARTSDDDITLFKNGGGAHLDLMTSNYILTQWRARRETQT